MMVVWRGEMIGRGDSGVKGMDSGLGLGRLVL